MPSHYIEQYHRESRGNKETDERGKASEDRVEKALQLGKSKGRLPWWMVRWQHIPPHTELDRMGADFMFLTDKGPIPLQVKSSECGRKKFENWCDEDVPVVVVGTTITPELLLKNVITLIAQVRRKKIKIEMAVEAKERRESLSSR